MNAIEWLGCPSSNFMPGRNAARVLRIVIHTMVGTVASANARFQNPGTQVSAHYGVGLDGHVVQWVRDDDTAYHAGNWDVNLTTIGIEHEDDGQYDAPRSDALYEASGALVRQLCGTFGIPIDRTHIVGHREVHATACPDALDIDRIVRIAAQEDEAMTPAQEAKLDRVIALLEAREPLVWIAREQRALDVETGKAFDPSKGPIDPRVKA